MIDLVGKAIGVMRNSLDLEVFMMMREIEYIVDLCLRERKRDLEW